MAAKTKSAPISAHRKKPRKKRPGIHSKKKASKSKRSKNYLKRYRSQGK